MTSALVGGRGSPKAADSTDKLRECDSDKGGDEGYPTNPKMLWT